MVLVHSVPFKIVGISYIVKILGWLTCGIFISCPVTVNRSPTPNWKLYADFDFRLSLELKFYFIRSIVSYQHGCWIFCHVETKFYKILLALDTHFWFQISKDFRKSIWDLETVDDLGVWKGCVGQENFLTCYQGFYSTVAMSTSHDLTIMILLCYITMFFLLTREQISTY